MSSWIDLKLYEKSWLLLRTNEYKTTEHNSEMLHDDKLH